MDGNSNLYDGVSDTDIRYAEIWILGGCMIKARDIALFRGQYGVGQRIKATKVVSSERRVETEVEIVGIYPFFVLVQDVIDPKYKWSMKWIDLMLEKGIV